MSVCFYSVFVLFCVFSLLEKQASINMQLVVMEKPHTIVGGSMTGMFCFLSQSYVTTDGRPVLSWGQTSRLGPNTRFLLLQDSCVFIAVWRHL
jgi:hypothetical protein